MISETNNVTISSDSKVLLRPLSRQLENGIAIIGWGNQFLELPPEGLQFIAWLDEGLSLAEARKRFEALYNPFPESDLLEVMHAFLENDFIASVDGQSIAPRYTPSKTHADWVPQKWAKLLFSTPILIAWMIIVIPATVLWIINPELWPLRANYFWIEYNFMIILVGFLLWLINMPLHELAHLLACRAKGIDATITWTQRMGFIPMSQTIMHNIWAVPRPTRFLPIAAGMVLDVFRISVVVYLLFFDIVSKLENRTFTN